MKRPAWREAAWMAAGLAAVAVATWLLPASVHIVRWPAGGPARIAFLAPRARLIWLLAAAMLATLALAGWSWRRGSMRSMAARIGPLGLLWLWTVPYWPWLPDRAPVLLALAGPLRWVVVALAVAAALPRSVGEGPLRRFQRWQPGRRSVFAVSLGLYLLCGLASARVMGPGGDEPHYLMIAHSLLADGDLKIENNHKRGDYGRFYPRQLRPDYLRRGQDGEIYSIHAPGLPVLLLPAYAAAGYRGAVAFVCLLAALTALAVFTLALAVTAPQPRAGPDPGCQGSADSRRAALITWVAVCLTVPFVPHAWLLYPEMPATLIVAWAACWIWQPVTPRWHTWALRGAALAVLPWLHTKFVLLLAGFGAALVVRVWRRRGALAGLLAPVVASVGGWLAYFYVIYGTVDPEAPYGGSTRLYVLAQNIPRGLLGLLVDQKFGLLIHSPLYLFAGAGAWLMLRRPGHRYLGAVLLGVMAAFVGATARFYMWWGGSSAPARFLVPMLPCLAPLIALAVQGARGPVARALLAVWLIVGLAVALAGAAWPSRLFFYSDPHGGSRLLETLQGSAPLTLTLPAFTEEDWRSTAGELGPWLLAALLGLGVMVAAARYLNVRSAGWLAVLGCAAFLATGSVAARPTGPDERAEAARRGAIDLLWRYNASRMRAFDYGARQWVDTAQAVRSSTVVFSSYPAGRFALPPGRYQAHVWFAGTGARRGEIAVVSSLHRATFGRLAGTLDNPALVAFELPVSVSRLSVTLADAALGAAVARIEIAPLTIVPSSARDDVPVRAIESIAGRPGAYLVYVDRQAYPEGGVFWTRTTTPATVLVAPAGASRLALTLFTGPLGSEVDVTMAGEAERVTVPPHAARKVERTLPVGMRVVPLTIRSSTEFRPADHDPATKDTRRLGCQVRVELK